MRLRWLSARDVPHSSHALPTLTKALWVVARRQAPTPSWFVSLTVTKEEGGRGGRREEGKHRASCGERMRDPSVREGRARASPSASQRSAALIEVDKTRKRDVQTGGAAGALERRRRWHFFSGEASQ